MLQVSENSGAMKTHKFHYAFIICLGGFFTQFVVLTCQRLPSVSLELIRDTLGIGYTEVGLITSWFMIFYAGLSLFWGWLSDRIGAKKSLALSVLVAAIGTISFGLFAQYGLVFAIVIWSLTGFGCAGLLMAVIPKLVARWFVPEKRGFGMALIMPGANVASIIIGIVVPLVIAQSGWQLSFVYFGVAFVVISILVGVCVKDDPSSVGLTPYGSPRGTQAAPTPVIEKEKLKTKVSGSLVKVIKMPITWRFAVMYILWQIGYMAATVYYVSSVQYAGFTLAEAGLGLTWAGLATIVSIQIWGNLSDRMERKYVITIASFCCMIFGFLYFFVLLGTPSLGVCWFLVALITASTGVVTAIMTAAGDCYPAEIRGTGTGFLSTLAIIGRYLGPWIAGVIVDAMAGQVGYAYLVVGVMMGLAGVAALMLPKLRGTANMLS